MEWGRLLSVLGIAWLSYPLPLLSVLGLMYLRTARYAKKHGLTLKIREGN